MFLKSPHKFSFSSLTFALVLSTNLLFSGESFAAADDDFALGHKSFTNALQELKGTEQFTKFLNNADRRFLLAFEDYPENSIGQAKTKLFWARAIALRDGVINAKPMFEEAIKLYRIAEKDALNRDGLADALFYYAKNSLSIEDLRKTEAVQLDEGKLKNRKLAYAQQQHEVAKASFEESLNLSQTAEKKIRTGDLLATIWGADKDNQKRKNVLVKIVNEISDPKSKAPTQRDIIDFCFEVNPLKTDAHYIIAKDDLIKIVDEIEDVQYKAETQKRMGEFFFKAKDLPNSIKYLTLARTYFSQNAGGYLSYKALDENAVGEINVILQHAKFLTGLYTQSIKDGVAAKEWIASLVSTKEGQNKIDFQRKLVLSLNHLGNAHLQSGKIIEAESYFNDLNNYIINVLLPEYTPNLSQSMAFTKASIDNINNVNKMLQYLYSYKIAANVGLTHVKIEQKNIGSAATYLNDAQQSYNNLVEGANDNNLTPKAQAELKIKAADLALKILATEKADLQTRSSRLNPLIQNLTELGSAKAQYYDLRDQWRLVQSLADAYYYSGNIEDAKASYISAITAAKEAGYKHFEMLARNQLAVMLDTNLRGENEILGSLEKELAELKKQKIDLSKEVIALKKVKSSEDAILAEIVAKETELVAKDGEIAAKEQPIAALKGKIGKLIENRNRESGIADSLKLVCELRAANKWYAEPVFTEDQQKSYLMYLNEQPIASSLNKSQIIDNFEQPVDSSISKDDQAATPIVESSSANDTIIITPIVEPSLVSDDIIPIIQPSSSNDEEMLNVIVNALPETQSDPFLASGSLDPASIPGAFQVADKELIEDPIVEDLGDILGIDDETDEDDSSKKK